MPSRINPRVVAAVLAVLASLWSLFLLPAQHVAWESLPDYPAPGWAHAIEPLPIYDGYRALFAPLGWTEDYLLFGASASVSFVLLAFAMRPITTTLGVTGAITFWVTLASGPMVIVSYLARDWPHPLRALWGIEPFLLIAIGLLAIVCAIAAFRRGIRPRWPIVRFGALLAFFIGGAVLFAYYPHGSMVIGGLAVAASVGWWDTRSR
ncbi:hypothetical protein [Cryobacterium sp. BB736]|uniref:hypothetical protein n=2 Tax=unclassified Cryobacterium TaxID=2649013 RepID=UPI001876DBDF|nr:hypothetical protein [Cryobacterium sp. BB736]